MKVGIVAPSSVVPRAEFKDGFERLKRHGFTLEVHRSVLGKRDFIFSASADVRATALFEFAMRPDLEVIWAARGGYGAIDLLPRLDQLARQKGKPPKKLYVGFSDSTAILSYVAREWGWSVLHAPMVAMMDAKAVDRAFKQTAAAVSTGRFALPPKALKAIRPGTTSGQLVGGNLSVIGAMLGTPYAMSMRDKVLFLEDVAESPSRIDRLVAQLSLSGTLAGCRGIMLGDFTGCLDTPPRSGSGKKSKPVRPTISTASALKHIFGRLGETIGCPIFTGYPAGHGPNFYPVPLGAEIQIGNDGRLQVLNWAR